MRQFIVLSLLCVAAMIAHAETNDLFQQAWDLNWRGEHAAAVSGYEQFASDNVGQTLAPVALFNAASITMVEMGDIDAARMKFKELTETYPGTKWTADSYRRLAEIALEKGDIKVAVDNYKLGLKNYRGEDFEMPDVWVTEMIDGCRDNLVAIDDPGYSVIVYEDVLAFIPHGSIFAETQYNLAGALKSLGRNEEAADKMCFLLYNYAAFPISATVMAEEREFISEYVELPWGDIEKMNLIQGLFQQSDYDQVEQIFSEVRENNPDTPLDDRCQYGLIITNVYRSGDFKTALDNIEDLLAKFPESGWSNQARNNIGFWEEAQSLKDRLKLEPDDYSTHVSLGYRLLRNRFNEQAEEHFLVATADTTSDAAYMGLGYTYLRSGRVDDAIKAFDKFLESSPDDGNVYNQVGYAYIGQGQPEEALRYFERYRELEPDNPNSHDSYAECLMNLERYEEAIAEYKRAIELNPGFTNPYFMLGEIYNRTGDTERALKYYQQYIDSDPNGFQSASARENVQNLTKQ